MLGVAKILFGSPQELNSWARHVRGTEVMYFAKVSLKLEWAFTSKVRAEVRQEDRLNLSILLSRGKETNLDSLSNGE